MDKITHYVLCYVTKDGSYVKSKKKGKTVTSLHPFNINVVSRQLALDRDYCPIRDFLVFQFPDDGHGRLWGGKQVSAIERWKEKMHIVIMLI